MIASIRKNCIIFELIFKRYDVFGITRWFILSSISLFFVSTTVFAAPAPQVVARKSNLIIVSGSSFGEKASPSPIYWNKFESETVGQIPVDQKAGHASNTFKVIEDGSRDGSKTLSYRYETSGSEIFGRNYIDLGPQNNIYATMWVKIVNAGTSKQFDWKGEYISSHQLDYNGSAPHTTITKVNWWSKDLNKWFNPSYYLAPPNAWPNSPAGTQRDQYLFDKWQRIEYWVKRNSGLGVADGTIYIHRIGLTTPIENRSVFITHNATYTDTWRYLNLGQGVTSNYTGTIDFTVSYDDIYVDTTPARVELCDTNTWTARTHCEIQPPTAWSDTSITTTFNQGSFTTGQTVYVYVVDANGAVNSNGVAYTIKEPLPVPLNASGTRQ